jgi:hypothetical protein
MLQQPKKQLILWNRLLFLKRKAGKKSDHRLCIYLIIGGERGIGGNCFKKETNPYEVGTGTSRCLQPAGSNIVSFPCKAHLLLYTVTFVRFSYKVQFVLSF